MCWLHLCGHKTNSDADGIWGECVTCGHRAGYVTREQMRAYADREIAREMAARQNPKAGASQQ